MSSPGTLLAVVRTVMWLAIALFAAAVGLEILLQYRVASKLEQEPRTVRGDLDRAYAPFSIQHLHPQYMFFFPLDPDERVTIANNMASLDRDGFREPGPAHANGRKLAVMLGGSAAFGHFASSNDTTITSFLNRLQDEFFFVNAGVPSWNSTQELSRLVFQIAGLKPALVMTYDGANDSALAVHDRPQTGKPYPPGTPDSFEDLEQWVDDLRSDQWLLRPPILFPEIRSRLLNYLGLVDEDSNALPPWPNDRVAIAADLYLANQHRMALISRALGARFICVFQPIAGLHHNVPESFRQDEASVAFHRVVAAAPAPEYEFHDLAAWFDTQMPAIPAGEPAGGNRPIFVDNVHLFDAGNEMIAKKLVEIVRAERMQ